MFKLIRLIRLVVAIAMLGGLITLLFNTGVLESFGINRNQKGRAVMTISFGKDVSLKQVKDWLENAKKTGEQWISKEISTGADAGRIEQLSKSLAESLNIDIGNIVKENLNGVEIELPLYGCEIKFDDGAVLKTDKDGYFSAAKLKPGVHSVTITRDGVPQGTAKVTVGDNGKVIGDIKIENSLKPNAMN